MEEDEFLQQLQLAEEQARHADVQAGGWRKTLRVLFAVLFRSHWSLARESVERNEERRD